MRLSRLLIGIIISLVLVETFSSSTGMAPSATSALRRQNQPRSVTASSIVKGRSAGGRSSIEYFGETTNNAVEHKDVLDVVIMFLDDPRTDLFVGFVAGSLAAWELVQDFQKIGAHHGLLLITLMHALKAFTSVLKEGKRALKGFKHKLQVDHQQRIIAQSAKRKPQ